MLEQRKGDWAATWSGHRFYVLDPRPEDMTIEDGAHHLARTCRYGGAIEGEWYSVAEHCYHLARYILELPLTHDLFASALDPWTLRRLFARWMLMHDIGEAWYGDVRRPIKNSAPSIADAMRETDLVAACKWDLPHPMHHWMKDLDNRIVMDEKMALIRSATDGTPWHQEVNNVKPLGIHIQGWAPAVAEEKFLNMFRSF